MIDDKFQALLNATDDLLAARNAKTTKSQESIHNIARDMMDAVSSGEKRMVGRQPAVFLSEFPALIERIKH